jgi:molybdopterin/thiamine biosynthesis adenylyltransferase
LCRLLIGSDIPLLLIDPDRVEPHNLVRQNFYEADLGKFKSQALAEKIGRASCRERVFRAV